MRKQPPLDHDEVILRISRDLADSYDDSRRQAVLTTALGELVRDV